MSYDSSNAKDAIRAARVEAMEAGNDAIGLAMNAGWKLMQETGNERLDMVKADMAFNLGGYKERISANRELIQNLEAQMQTLLYGLERDIDGVQKIVTRLNEQDGND